MPAPNSSFSTKLPWHQLAIDSHSLGEFKRCSRLYYYTVIMGYTPPVMSVHLRWGLLLHAAVEQYYKLKYAHPEWDHNTRVAKVFRQAALDTWDAKLNRPWDSGHKIKTRLTLLRTIVWYLDKFGDNDPIQTLVFGDGRPAVEVSFRFDLGRPSSLTGERYLLCGHLDRMGKLNNSTYIIDVKSTTMPIDYTILGRENYFEQFTPNNQMSLYYMAGGIIAATDIAGIIIDAAQVTTTSTNFRRAPIDRTPAQLDEWANATSRWIDRMEVCASDARRNAHHEPDGPSEEHWPQNDNACGMYGGCEFREVCSKSPGARRNEWLALRFKRRVWDPLQIRGDI